MANTSMFVEMTMLQNDLRRAKHAAKVFEDENRIIHARFEGQDKTIQELKTKLEEAEKAKAMNLKGK